MRLQKNFILNNSNFDPEQMFLENKNSFTRYTFTQKEFLQIIIKSLQNAHFGSRQARGDNEF